MRFSVQTAGNTLTTQQPQGSYVFYNDPGTAVTYHYRVTNTGELPVVRMTITDDKLGIVGTNDGPLARNAQLQGVPTTNLRKLAQELTPSIGPGDFVRVSLTRPGKEDGQGVIIVGPFAASSKRSRTSRCTRSFTSTA